MMNSINNYFLYILIALLYLVQHHRIIINLCTHDHRRSITPLYSQMTWIEEYLALFKSNIYHLIRSVFKKVHRVEQLSSLPSRMCIEQNILLCRMSCAFHNFYWMEPTMPIYNKYSEIVAILYSFYDEIINYVFITICMRRDTSKAFCHKT